MKILIFIINIKRSWKKNNLLKSQFDKMENDFKSVNSKLSKKKNKVKQLKISLEEKENVKMKENFLYVQKENEFSNLSAELDNVNKKYKKAIDELEVVKNRNNDLEIAAISQGFDKTRLEREREVAIKHNEFLEAELKHSNEEILKIKKETASLILNFQHQIDILRNQEKEIMEKNFNIEKN